eukprot:5542404-Alexandrium_andersonii.AAC.1
MAPQAKYNSSTCRVPEPWRGPLLRYHEMRMSNCYCPFVEPPCSGGARECESDAPNVLTYMDDLVS